MKVNVEFLWSGGEAHSIRLSWWGKSGLSMEKTMNVPKDFNFHNRKDRQGFAKRFKEETGLQGKRIHFW